MPNKKSYRKKYNKDGENTSSSSRRKRREEIREKTAAAAENRRKRQTYRQPSYQPRQRRNLRRYLTMNRRNLDNTLPFQDYVMRECFGHECDLLYPHTRQPIYDRAMINRNRDLLMSELNSRILPAEDRIRRRNERNQARMSLNRMMSEGNLDELDSKVSDNIMRFI